MDYKGAHFCFSIPFSLFRSTIIINLFLLLVKKKKKPKATNLSASTKLDLSRLACEFVGLEIVDRARVSPSYASAAPDAPDRAALAWPPPALVAAVDDFDDDDEGNGGGGNKRRAASHTASSSSAPISSRSDARRIVSPPVLLLVGKRKKQSSTEQQQQQQQQQQSDSSSPPFSLRPLSCASWSVSLRLPLGSPATLRGGPGSPVRYNYRIQALARYRDENADGSEGELSSSSLAAAAVAVRVLPPRSPASASAFASGLLTGAAAEPEPCRYEPGALIKGLRLSAERLLDDDEDDEESSDDSEEEDEEDNDGNGRVKTPPLAAAATAAARKKNNNKKSASARPFSSSSSAAAPSLLSSGSGLVSLSPARRQHPRPSTAGGEKEERSSFVVAVGGEKPFLQPPPPPPPPPPPASARSFNLRAPGGTLARLTLHGPPDGLPLTPGATLRGTLDLRPPQQQQQRAPVSSPSSSNADDNDDEKRAEQKDAPLPPPICARFAVALESVEAVASKWAIRGAGGGVVLAMPPDRIRVGTLIRQLEGDQPMVECFRADGGSCTLSAGCRLRGFLDGAREDFYRSLDARTVADCLTGALSAATG